MQPARRALRPSCLLASALGVVSAFPATARADSHEVALGGSVGAYRWAGETCPYVTPCDFPMEVRVASVGARYQARLGEARLREGHALIVDVRTELTRSRVDAVEGNAPEAVALASAEQDRSRWLGALQIAVGYDGPLLGVRGGLGVVGTTRLVGNRIESRYLQGDEARVPVPNAEVRIGPLAGGPSLRLGAGLVPLVGAGRWYTLYALARASIGAGVEVSAGGAWVVLEQTDGHAAALLSVSAPLGPARVSAFAMLDPWTPRPLVDGGTYGVAIALRVDPVAPRRPDGPPIGVTVPR